MILFYQKMERYLYFEMLTLNDYYCRLLEVIGCKIYSIQLEDMSLETLSSTGTTKSLRVEEVPKEEQNLGDDETLIHVAHFHKVCPDNYSTNFIWIH